jgi:ribosomal-protein-alanine N-acetyltransferase
MPDPGLTDGAVVLRQWRPTDADWYADAAHDPEVQRYTTESPTLTTAEVRAVIVALADQADTVGLVVCEATTGQRLGNIALRHDATVGEVSYWVAASARGRGVATRALRLLSAWAFATLGLSEIRLWPHADNLTSPPGRRTRRLSTRTRPRPAAHRQRPGLGHRRLSPGRCGPGWPAATGHALTPHATRSWPVVIVLRR